MAWRAWKAKSLTSPSGRRANAPPSAGAYLRVTAGSSRYRQLFDGCGLRKQCICSVTHGPSHISRYRNDRRASHKYPESNGQSLGTCTSNFDGRHVQWGHLATRCRPLVPCSSWSRNVTPQLRGRNMTVTAAGRYFDAQGSMRGAHGRPICLLHRASYRDCYCSDRAFSGTIRGRAVVDGRRRGPKLTSMPTIDCSES
jgi:hypothetical protein